ncbi:polyprenyl synthetase family protein [Deltaproteobacteria bacterium TL4]
MNHFVEAFNEDLSQIKLAIRSGLKEHLPFLSEIIQYLVESQEVSWRSLVLLMSTQVFTPITRDTHQIGSVLEYLHVAAKMHRHIGNAETLRRYQKQLLGIWGNEASVLLGDYLLSRSFQTLTQLGNLEILDAVSLTTQLISRGQVLEISEPFYQFKEVKYLEMLECKTASLVGAAAKSGAILGKANEALQHDFYEYGLCLGKAIHLRKDLEVAQNPLKLQELLERQEANFLICHVLNLEVKEPNKEDLVTLLKSEEPPDVKAERLQQAFVQGASFEYTRTCIRDALCQAREHLISCKESQTLTSLIDGFLTWRL